MVCQVRGVVLWEVSPVCKYGNGGECGDHHREGGTEECAGARGQFQTRLGSQSLNSEML